MRRIQVDTPSEIREIRFFRGIWAVFAYVGLEWPGYEWLCPIGIFMMVIIPGLYREELYLDIENQEIGFVKSLFYGPWNRRFLAGLEDLETIYVETVHAPPQTRWEALFSGGVNGGDIGYIVNLGLKSGARIPLIYPLRVRQDAEELKLRIYQLLKDSYEISLGLAQEKTSKEAYQKMQENRSALRQKNILYRDFPPWLDTAFLLFVILGVPLIGLGIAIYYGMKNSGG